ncbi:MAG: hypothetical protein ACYC96_03340 [Fimbriimonadaceae bacterium]
MATKQKFATQLDPTVLAQTRAYAQSEGRQVQSVVEEALTEYLAAKHGSRPRPEVMAHYEASLVQFDELYKKLAE